MLASTLLGAHILALFGISLPVVRVGGGLLVAAAGWRMLHRAENDDVHAAAAVKASGLTDIELVPRSFFPMTFPLTTGPGNDCGVHSTWLADPRTSVLSYVVVALAVAGGAALVSLVLYFLFKSAAAVLARLGETSEPW